MKVFITKGPMFEKNLASAQKYLCEVLMKEIAQNEEKFSQKNLTQSQKEVS